MALLLAKEPLIPVPVVHPRPYGSFGSTCQLYSQLCIIEKSEKH